MMKSQSQPVAAVVVATETKKAVSAPKEKAAPKRRRGEESETVDGKKAVKKVKRTRTKRLVVDGDDAPKRSTGGLSKPMRLSAPLAALLGVPEENRCQVRYLPPLHSCHSHSQINLSLHSHPPR